MTLARSVRRPRSGPRRLTAVGLSTAITFPLLGAVAPAANADEHDLDERHVLIFTATEAGPWHDAAIDYGVPILQDALDAVNISSVATHDPAIFNDDDLAQFDALVMFQTNGDPWNAEQKAAMESYQQAGGGIAAIHNATDMRGNYQWWDDLIGALMPGHAATSPPLGLQAIIQVEDDTHPSTSHLEDFEWIRSDEWYNYDVNVRGDAHVLLTLDESTYNPGGFAMGYDHPISWCKPYDGGKAFITGLGHFPGHYDEPDLVQHVIGGIQWAAGQLPGDCGGTMWEAYDKVPLDTNTSAPFGMDVASDGRVFFSELVRGQIRVFNPQTHTTTTALTIPVYSGGEDGMLDIALDPDFDDNGYLYLYYSPVSDQSVYVNRLSRFTVDVGNTIDPDSETVIIEIPKQRFDQPGHTGGGLGFDPDGNLLLSVGDDINPHSEPSPRSAPLSTIDGTFHDARETSANTADLRGKLLRITPLEDGGYTVPEGNLFNSGAWDHLFPDGAYDPDLARPEIYAMGFRNPFRFSVDPVTGNIGMADYGPDCNSLNECGNYGPTGAVSWSLITEPGNYGWPLCHGDRAPYRDVDYTTNPRTFGDLFDCDNPVNDSPRNTGLEQLPPVVAPDMVYGYQTSTVPEIIPQGGGLAPMGGPIYRYDADSDSETKFPEYFDGKPFFYEWSKNRLYSMIVDESAPEGDRLNKINHFLPPPNEQWRAPIDLKFGADGSLYVLEWGGGFGRHNPDSGLYRIDYVPDGRSPVAVAEATPDSGTAPLEVQFSSAGSHDPDGGELTFEWDFENDGDVDSTDPNPTYTYSADGVYDARLTVTNPNGRSGVAVVPVTVGNTRPTVEFAWPLDGGFFEFGDTISWELEVTDPEDDEIIPENAIVQPAVGHDDHAHSFDPITGLTGSWTTGLAGHSRSDNAFYVFDGRYTDQGTDTAPPLEGSATVVLQPKRKQAEHYSDSDGVTVLGSNDIEEGLEVISGQNGAWAAYTPVNLINIDSIAVRVAAAGDGVVELRRDAPDGDLLGTADVVGGGLSSFADVTVEVDDPGDTFTLYLVFPGAGERRVNFFEANGKGVSPETRPEVRITSPDGSEQLEVGEVEITADAADAENEITQVEFFVDGESIGVDTTAPYSVTWDVTEERRYRLTAVATNDLGLTRTSRIVVAQVGELFGQFETFANTAAEFERLGANEWAITANGANMWQGVDEYGSLYVPAVAGTLWEATVRVDSQQNTHNSAKAGLIVRNDVTQPAQSRGYAVMAMRAGNAFEWLRDTGTPAGGLNVSTNAGSHGYPAWVRIRRDGDEYTSYWSTDGVNFTAVGTEVLPGAADVQDIGMVVTAHNANATSRAVFSDFVLDLDPDSTDPDPDPEHPAPVCEMSQSDQFDGDALNTTRWTTVRTAPDAEITVAGGSLVLPVTDGDINEAETGPVSYVGQPAREGEWEIETEVSIEHTREWQHAAVVMHGDDDNYVKLAFTRNSTGARFVEFQSESGGSRTWHDSQTVATDFPSTIHLRLVSDGSQLTAAYSADGESWTAMGGAAAVIDDATVGLFAAGDTGTPEVNAEFAHFTVTPDTDDDGIREPSDEFDGDALDGCRWNAVVRYNPETVEVVDGELRIETELGDINGTNNDDPRNFILQSVPDGDWTIETRLTSTMLHQWQLAGIMVYGDDDNYVKLDVVAFNTAGSEVDLRAELVSEINAQFGAGGNRNVDIPNSPDGGWWHLRLAKTGTSYEGWISEDGESWTSLGAPVTNDADLHSFGLMAIGPEQQEPVTVAFDYFRVVDAVDETPPVVEVTTEPEAADGQEGWFVTAPVTVHASATDDSGGPVFVEFRTGGGDWVEYTEPVELSEDGIHVLEFRGTDESENTSDPVPVEVKLDTTAPELSVEGVGDGDVVTDLVTPFEVAVVADDATSGLASVTFSLNGEEVASPVSIEPEIGEHVLVATATDEAGNTAEVTVTFTVEVTYDGASGLLAALRDDGTLSAKQYNQLRSNLATAERHHRRGNFDAAEAALGRFAAEAWLVGDAAARDLLLAVAEELRSQLGE